jgi:putative FmdB family regulatory protein
MPTYEYACTKCGHQFEHFQSMLDAPLKKCPKCAKTGLKRLVGAGAGLIFKGTGFYITDYKNKSPEKAAAGEKTPTAASTSEPVQPVKGRPAEMKPEAKPASTPAKAADTSKKK